MDNSLSWEVTSSIGVSSILFGTMHIRNECAFHDIGWLKEVILSKSYFYSEMDLSPDTEGVIQSSHILQHNTSLLSLYGDKKFKRIQRIIHKSFGVDIQQLNQLYPMIVVHILLESMLVHSSEVILDQVVHSYALQHKRKVKFLESKSEQMGIFQKIPLDLQLKQLNQLAKNPHKAKKGFMQLCHYYAQKNTQQLYHSSMHQMGGLRKPLLFDRNVRMANLLALNCQEQDSFVAVGAAHLFGEKGILRLLKHKNFKVRPIHKPVY